MPDSGDLRGAKPAPTLCVRVTKKRLCIPVLIKVVPLWCDYYNCCYGNAAAHVAAQAELTKAVIDLAESYQIFPT
jgi:hypothetical protein